jgi:hypothetical protein
MEDGFELDGCESAEAALAPAAMVGPFDPVDDPGAELVAGLPALPVEDVLLEQREEGLHRGVVAARADAAHRADHLVVLVVREASGEGSGTELAASVGVDDDATVWRRAAALSSASTASWAVIRSVIE